MAQKTISEWKDDFRKLFDEMRSDLGESYASVRVYNQKEAGDHEVFMSSCRTRTICTVTVSDDLLLM